MKRNLLLVLIIFISSFASAQVVLNLLPPSEFMGSYPFIPAATPAQASNGWPNIADMEDPANSITGVFAYGFDDGTWGDGTAGDSAGCGPLINPEDIAGKIAVIYRGACHFSLKAYNAQIAGAIGCMIVNAVAPFPDASLGGGDSVNAVIIPTFMVTNDVASGWRPEIEAGTLSAFYGSKVGLFNNDLGMTTIGMLRAEHSVHPTVLSQNGSYVVQVGGDIINYGQNSQSNVSLAAVISKDDVILYNETSSPVSNMDNGDTLAFDLPPFTLDDFASGYYKVNYTIIFSEDDEFPADNVFETNFTISDSLFAYSNVSPETGATNGVSYFRPTGAADNVQNCIEFKDPNASSVIVEGMTFSTSYDSEVDMTGATIDVLLYEWIKEFEDIDDGNFGLVTTDLEELAFGSFEYPNDDLRRENVYVPFEDGALALDDDVRYLFCVSFLDEFMFVGFDGPSLNYATNLNFYRQPLFPLEDNDVWNPVVGYGTDIVPAITVSMRDPLFDAINEQAQRVSITPFPNPAVNEINIPIENYYGKTLIDVYDIAGKKVKSLNVTTSSFETIKVDVSDLDNGAYLFKMNFEDGSYSNFNVIVNN